MSHPGFLREVQGIDDTLHLSEKSGGKRECAKQRRKAQRDESEQRGLVKTGTRTADVPFFITSTSALLKNTHQALLLPVGAGRKDFSLACTVLRSDERID